MPLDSRKAAHIQAVLPQTWAGRQKTVTLVTAPGGTQTYTAAQVIFRPQAEVDPTVADAAGSPPRRVGDMLMIAPITLTWPGCSLWPIPRRRRRARWPLRPNMKSSR